MTATVIPFKPRPAPTAQRQQPTSREIMAAWDRLIAQIATEMKEPK